MKLIAVGAFERRRYMNLVVHKARHPQLHEYIHSAVNGLQPFITKVLQPPTQPNYYFHSFVFLLRFII